MVELLVFANDDGPDHVLHPMRYRVGDVVAAMSNGHRWGTLELCRGSAFRVVVFPGHSIADAEPLLSEQRPELDMDLSPITHRRRRGFGLDIAHPTLPPEFAAWWGRNDGTTYLMPGVVTIAALTVRRAPLPLPRTVA